MGAQAMLSLFEDFENFSTFKPGARKEQLVTDVIDQLIPCGGAMRGVRQRASQ